MDRVFALIAWLSATRGKENIKLSAATPPDLYAGIVVCLDFTTSLLEPNLSSLFPCFLWQDRSFSCHCLPPHLVSNSFLLISKTSPSISGNYGPSSYYGRLPLGPHSSSRRSPLL